MNAAMPYHGVAYGDGYGGGGGDVKCEPSWDSQQQCYAAGQHQLYSRGFAPGTLPRLHPLASAYGNNYDFYGVNGGMGGQGEFLSQGCGPCAPKNEMYGNGTPLCAPPDIPSSPNEPKPTVTLENDELWTPFHKVGTEMVITKNGR